MMFEKTKKTVALMLMFMGIKKLPIKDGAVDLTPEQDAKLREAFGTKINLDDALVAVNKELANAAGDEATQDQRLVDCKTEIEEMLREHGLSEEDVIDQAADKDGPKGDAIDQLAASLKVYQKQMDKHLSALVGQSEDDTAVALINKSNIEMKHSSTHLLGSARDYDAFEGRSWNRLASGQTESLPTFAKDSVEVATLKTDLNLYHRELDTEVKSTFRDMLGLPSWWKIKTGVVDKITTGNVMTGEISQARKKGWLPKNKQKIQPETGQIFPVQIDIEFSGYELQVMLTSWLQDYNKEGSQSYKWTFVRFLIKELDKRARQEDRIVAINGVYVATPDEATVAGLAINRGDGISIQLWRAEHFDEKYKSAKLAVPTRANVLDNVKSMIDLNLPEEEKNVGGLVIYADPTICQWHAERKREVFGGDNDYTGTDKMSIEGYPNVTLAPLHDWQGTLFMLLTYDDNIELLENQPKEKAGYQIDTLKREMYLFADYGWGSRIIHIGYKVQDGDPLAFKTQTVWTNGLSPFKSDFFVQLYDIDSTEVTLPYGNVTVANGYAKDIATLKGLYAGQIVKIKGNTAATATVTDDGNITLAGNADFETATGGTLTLRVGADLSLTELFRTSVVASSGTADESFAGTAIDADKGDAFNYTGGVATMTSIINGVNGQEIIINGGAGGALTLANVAGVITLTAGAVLANVDDNISLTRVDGQWYEVSREIA